MVDRVCEASRGKTAFQAEFRVSRHKRCTRARRASMCETSVIDLSTSALTAPARRRAASNASRTTSSCEVFGREFIARDSELCEWSSEQHALAAYSAPGCIRKVDAWENT